MTKAIIGVIMLVLSASASAAGYTARVPLTVTFFAHLDLPVSDKSDLSELKKFGLYRVFDLLCEKSMRHCNLWVHDISDEYCKGQTSAPSQNVSVFSYDSHEDITLQKVGAEYFFEFDDLVLYGKTRNKIKIALAPKPTQYQPVVTSIAGTASAPVTSQGAPLQSQYRSLKDKVVCNISFGSS